LLWNINRRARIGVIKRGLSSICYHEIAARNLSEACVSEANQRVILIQAVISKPKFGASMAARIPGDQVPTASALVCFPVFAGGFSGMTGGGAAGSGMTGWRALRQALAKSNPKLLTRGRRA
jgi:hypothetical protein